MNNLSKSLSAYRQKHDMSQRDLAKSIGLPISTMCRVEQGKDFDLNTFSKLLAWMIK